MMNSENNNYINTEEEVIGLVNNHFIDLQQMSSSLEHANGKIQSALDKSKEAKDKVIHWYSGTTDAIKSLQEASVAQAEATTDLYNAVQESHNVMIRMAKSNQKLFLASVSNAAYIRAVIAQLKKRSSAEQSSLTEEARNQLLNVIRELERQADIYDKIERLKGKVNNLQDEFSTMNAKAVCSLALIEDLQNSMKEVHSSCFTVMDNLSSFKETYKSQYDIIQNVICELENTIHDLTCQNNKQASELVLVKQANSALKSDLDIINLNFSDLKQKTSSKLTVKIAIGLSLIAFILSFLELIV